MTETSSGVITQRAGGVSTIGKYRFIYVIDIIMINTSLYRIYWYFGAEY